MNINSGTRIIKTGLKNFNMKGGDNMTLNYEIEKVFSERLEDSNCFSKEEIKTIKDNQELFTKCYTLGCLDVFDFKSQKTK